MKKKLIVMTLMFLSLNLAGCFSRNVASDLRDVTVEKEHISIKIPRAWLPLDAKDLGSSLENVLVSYVDTTIVDGYSPSIVVLKEGIPDNTTAYDYGKAAIYKTSREMIEYIKLEEKEAEITDETGKKYRMIYQIFQGKERRLQNRLTYIQGYVTKGATGYTITIGLPVAEKGYGAYESIVKSFHFTK